MILVFLAKGIQHKSGISVGQIPPHHLVRHQEIHLQRTQRNQIRGRRTTDFIRQSVSILAMAGLTPFRPLKTANSNPLLRSLGTITERKFEIPW